MLGEVKELRLKKTRLLGVCEAQREMFARDWRQVETRLSWLETGTEFLARFRPGLMIAAPLAGLAVSLVWRRNFRLATILEQVTRAWELVSRLRSLSTGINEAKQLAVKDWP